LSNSNSPKTIRRTLTSSADLYAMALYSNQELWPKTTSSVSAKYLISTEQDGLDREGGVKFSVLEESNWKFVNSLLGWLVNK
jgi:SRSO17 transposase